MGHSSHSSKYIESVSAIGHRTIYHEEKTGQEGTKSGTCFRVYVTKFHDRFDQRL